MPLTKAECCLRLAEYGKAVGIISQRNQNNQEKAAVLATCPKCPFKLGWNRNKSTKGPTWVPSNYVRHAALCLGVSAVNQPHSMTSSQTAPVLYQLINDNPKLAKNVAKSALAAYLEKIPSDSFTGRAITAARNDTTGTVYNQAALIMCIKQALEANGHELSVLEMTTKEGQRKVIAEMDKKNHNKQKKWGKLLTKGDVGYDYVESPDLFKDLDRHPSGTKFLYGYTLRLKHMKELVGCLKTVFSCDAAHMKGSPGGTAFGAWGQDANKNIVCVALSVFFDNEGFDTWSAHLGQVKNWFPGLDIDMNIFIAAKL